MSEIMSYSETRNTQENKDFLKTIDKSLDNDWIIDNAEAKEILDQYKLLKSNILAISKEELWDFAQWLGLGIDWSLSQTMNKIKEMSQEAIHEDINTDSTKRIIDNWIDWSKNSSEIGISVNTGTQEASQLNWDATLNLLNVRPGEYDYKPNLDDYQTVLRPGEWEGGTTYLPNPMMNLRDNPIELSSIETQRKQNIKKALIDWFKEWGLIKASSTFGWLSIDFEWRDELIFNKMIDNLVTIINSKEKNKKVFLKNSEILKLAQNTLYARLKLLESNWSNFDDIVDSKELNQFKWTFKSDIDNLLNNKDNLQSNEFIISQYSGNGTLSKNPADSTVTPYSNNGENSGLTDSDSRRRIQKGDNNKNYIPNEKKYNNGKNLDTSKYWITPETKEKVIGKMAKLGLVTPTNYELNQADNQFLSSIDLNNVDRIIDNIKWNREYNKWEKERLSQGLLGSKEYLYNDSLMNEYSILFWKNSDEIIYAINQIFNQSKENYIKKTTMKVSLGQYFKTS